MISIYTYRHIYKFRITCLTKRETPRLICVHALGPESSPLGPPEPWGPRIGPCREPMGVGPWDRALQGLIKAPRGVRP